MKMADLFRKFGEELGATEEDRFYQGGENRQERMKREFIQLDSGEEQEREPKELEAESGEMEGDQGEETEEETRKQEEEMEEEMLGAAAPRPMRETRQRLTFTALGHFKGKNKK